MSHLPGHKHNLWTKVRSSTKQLSSSLANLSLRTEHDGDTEDATLIHKALVAHYTKLNEPFPEWLGVSLQQQQQYLQEQPQAQPQQRQPYQSQSAPPSSSTRSSSSSSSQYRRAPASSSFKDIYSRSSSAPQAQGAAHPQGSAPVYNRPMWGQSTESNDHSAAAAAAGQSNDRSAAMRDRLKRNNYRNNFGV